MKDPNILHITYVLYHKLMYRALLTLSLIYILKIYKDDHFKVQSQTDRHAL